MTSIIFDYKRKYSYECISYYNDKKYYSQEQGSIIIISSIILPIILNIILSRMTLGIYAQMELAQDNVAHTALKKAKNTSLRNYNENIYIQLAAEKIENILDNLGLFRTLRLNPIRSQPQTLINTNFL